MEWGGDAVVTLDEHGREDIKGVVNVPIVDDKFGVKLFGAQVKSDGFVYNTTLNEDVGGDDVQNYGFAAKWQPTDNFDIKLHYEQTKDESDQGAYVNRNTNNDNTCKFFGQCVYTTTDNENQNSSETRNFSDNEYDTTILTANYDFGNMVLTYIGATRDMEEQNMQSFDASPAAFLDMNYFNFWDQESHELRLTSNFDGPINFVAGLYSFEVDYEQYWDVSHLHFTYNQVLGFPLFPDVTAPTSVKTQGQRQQTDSWAAFFSADWAIGDRWNLTVGGRYTEEEKDFSGDNGSIGWNPAAGETRPTGQPTVEYDAEWSEFTPSASLRFNMTDNTMLWASYAEGFKSGGFFGRQANFNAIDVSFEPEFLTNMEVGFKSTLLDGAMTLNASYFFSDYDDKQVSVLVVRGPADVATVVNNIDSQEISGLEVDLSWQITQNWFVRANYGYLDAEYNEFYADLNGDDAETENSFMQPRNTPENTFGISTVYTAAIGPGNVQGVLAYRYRDAIQTDLVSQSPTTPPSPTNTGGIGAMGSIYDISAQLSYMFSDDRYRITVYGKNLTDQRELYNQTIGGIATRGYWNDPRTYGVEFAVSF
jgi:iron complex outermembrane receptor protein